LLLDWQWSVATGCEGIAPEGRNIYLIGVAFRLLKWYIVRPLQYAMAFVALAKDVVTINGSF
jgi:hypothetical protein